MDGGTWWATVHGVAKSRTQLSDFTFTFKAPTNLCYQHIDAAYDCSMYYQLSKLLCLWPDQQATTCSASSTSKYKTTADHGKYHSPLDGQHYEGSQA